MRIGKRADLEHCSVAELIVQASRIAKGKGRVKAAKDLAWIVVTGDKHKLITYIASDGERDGRDDDGDGGNKKPVRAKDVPHWKKGW